MFILLCIIIFFTLLPQKNRMTWKPNFHEKSRILSLAISVLPQGPILLEQMIPVHIRERNIFLSHFQPSQAELGLKIVLNKKVH